MFDREHAELSIRRPASACTKQTASRWSYRSSQLHCLDDDPKWHSAGSAAGCGAGNGRRNTCRHAGPWDCVAGPLASAPESSGLNSQVTTARQEKPVDGI